MTMIHATRYGLLIFALMVLRAVANAQFPGGVLLDTITGPQAIPHKSLVTSTGDVYVAWKRQGGLDIHRVGPQGDITASKRISPAATYSTFNLIERPDGGILVAAHLETTQFGSQINDWDTIRTKLGLYALTYDLELTWAKDLINDRIYPMAVWDMPYTLEVSSNGDHYLLKIHWMTSDQYLFMLMQLDLQGQLEWTIQLSDDWTDSMTTARATVAPAPTGGWYICRRTNSSSAKLAYITSAGSTAWIKRFDYTNTAPMLDLEDMKVLSNGTVVMVGLLHLSTGQKNWMLRSTGDGDFIDAHLYQPTEGYSTGFGELQLNDAGEMFLLTKDNKLDLVKMAPDGTIMNAWKVGLSAQPPLNDGTDWRRLQLINNTPYLIGNYVTTDPIFATTFNRPLIWSIPDLSTACIGSQTTYEHFPVPQGLYTVTSLNAANGPTPPSVAEDGNTTFTPIPSLGTTTFCGNVVSVESTLAPERSILVRPNPALVGSPIEINGPLIDHIEVYDTQGRRLMDRTVPAMEVHQLSTAELSAGTYVVLLREQGGKRIHRTQVVLTDPK
jgi:hypothetical protein